MMDSIPQMPVSVLPGIAAQMRLSLGNLRLALLAAERADMPEVTILRQSYYRLLRTVTNMTDAAVLCEDTPVEKKDTELVSWFDDLCREAEVLVEACGLTIELRTELRSQVAAIHRDYTRRIFWNLLSNAMKYTAPGGRITVTLSRHGQQILLQMADTGCGIPQQMLDTVFDRFRCAGPADAAQGLGLGLPLCRAMAQRQGGRLLLQSAEGEGTCVTLALPVERSKRMTVQDRPFHYVGGFQPVVMELADALPHTFFAEKNLE